jgi:hypothetical protein
MQSDDLGLVERLKPRHVADEPLARAVVSEDQAERRAAVSAYLVANNALKREATDALAAKDAAIERLVAERDEALEISAKIADACRADIEHNPHDFGPLDQGGIRASEKIAAAIRARQALKDAT